MIKEMQKRKKILNEFPKQAYLPLKENGDLIKFCRTKNGITIPLSYINNKKKTQHLTIYFKEFKEINGNEELFYINIHLKDDIEKKKIFDKGIYFNTTKIKSIIENNIEHFFKIFDSYLFQFDLNSIDLVNIDKYLEQENLVINIEDIKKKSTASKIFENFDSRELKDINELKNYPYTKFKDGKLFYNFENDELYYKIEFENEVYFFKQSSNENIQKELFKFISSLFPNFTKELLDFVNIIDFHFPNFLYLDKLNNLLEDNK